jgi:hypothetical protein
MVFLATCVGCFVDAPTVLSCFLCLSSKWMHHIRHIRSDGVRVHGMQGSWSAVGSSPHRMQCMTSPTPTSLPPPCTVTTPSLAALSASLT